jgi:hypothetical protein
MLATFVKDWNVGSIYVYSPTSAVLLCGGEMTEVGVAVPKSLRDAFYKILQKPYLADAELVRAEDVEYHFVQGAHYKDLLRFEIELAQICDVILLFCESPGSVAELSSFVMDSSISPKLLVVTRDDYYHASSFVRLGPLRRLTNIDPQAVYLVDDADLNITARSVAKIDLAKLSQRLRAPIERALARGRERETFDAERAGHLIKLATGLVQEFGALTLQEIKGLLERVNVEPSAETLAGYMLCAKAVGWVRERRKGSKDFFFSQPGKPASALKFEAGSPLYDRIRRRYAIREFWRANDPDRHRGILENEGVGQ